MKNILVAAITAAFFTITLSSCDQGLPKQKENRQVIPDVKGIKIGSTMKEACEVAFEGKFNPSMIWLTSDTSYTVRVTPDSRISSIAGTSDFNFTLQFLKRQTPEESLLQSMTVVLPLDTFDGVLQGLKEKYGEGVIIGKTNMWYTFGTRYMVSVNKAPERSQLFLSITDMELNSEAVDRNNALKKKQDASASKDL